MFSSNTSQVVATATAAEAVDFDGTNDYLSRTSDLTGNTDSKTFTFSAWVWIPVGAPLGYLYAISDAGTGYFIVEVGAGQTIRIRGWKPPTRTAALDVTSSVVIPAGTFASLLVSIDLANTSNRRIYINDVLDSAPTWTTYANQLINFTSSRHDICGNGSSADGKKRISNVFLDYTYRDLSVEANRRLFVTADLKPAAGQAALNPILYLPMSDPTTVGTNAGTGGNFTLNGTIARSGRGPNQYNAPYSTFDGSADYLSRTAAPSGIADSKQFTFSCVFNANSATNRLLTFAQSTLSRLYIEFASDGSVAFGGYNSAGTNILLGYLGAGTIVFGRNYVFTISVDLANTANRSLYLNGVAQSVVWATYTDDNIDFAITTTPRYYLGASATPASFFNGKLGALWFNTSYIDLSVASNRAKFVTGTGIDAKPVDLGATGELPTGTAPLIYLPMYGNDAGKNYGTGGDFTVNSGPYTGARGPNEFWGNKATFNGTTGRLTKSAALTGVSAGKIFSASYFVTFAASATNQSMMHIANSGSSRLSIFRSTSNQLTLSGRNTSNTEILAATVTSPTIAAGSYSIQIVVDLANSANRAIYINGTAATVTWSTYTNGDIALASNTINLGVADTGSYIYYLNGSLSEFYFTTEYIDLSQEANRLKFRDAFGNPTDLPSAITAASVPTPAIYMRFPPISFGTNSGTGGDFTVNGTITDGGQL